MRHMKIQIPMYFVSEIDGRKAVSGEASQKMNKMLRQWMEAHCERDEERDLWWVPDEWSVTITDV